VGVLNATNSGSCSWYEFGREILSVAGLDDVVLEPVGTDAFPRPAVRPANSVLSLRRLEAVLGWVPRHWSEAVSEYIGER
jgi:dTDP-4-dehydrorhamnose reductase